MQKFMYRYRLLLSVMLYLLLFFGTLNWYRYYFDADGISYINIARLVANGEWMKSVNGFWSPLNSWIAAIFINSYTEPVLLFKYINAFFCSGIIVLVFLLSNRYIKTASLQTAVLLILPVLLLSYTHIQLAGDIMALFFYLCYAYLVTSSNFFSSLYKNILCAIVMTFAYTAKYYSLPYFIITHTILFFIHFWQNEKRQTFWQSFKPLLIALIVFILICLPWVYYLHLKYNEWLFSNAGPVNFARYLAGSGNKLKDHGLLIPPPYVGATAMGDDPYTYYEIIKSPFTSFQNLVSFLKLFFHNIKDALTAFTDISFLSLTVTGWFGIKFLKSKERKQSQFLLFVMAAVLTVGYLLVHIEERFIWFAAIVILIGGCTLLEEKIIPWLPLKITPFIILIFLLSFLLHPADVLQDLRNKGKDTNEIVTFFQNNNIKGKFAAHYNNASQEALLTTLAWKNNCQFYVLSSMQYSTEDLLNAIRQNKIDHYFYLYTSEVDKENFLLGNIAGASSQIIPLPGYNILIASFNNTR